MTEVRDDRLPENVLIPTTVLPPKDLFSEEALHRDIAALQDRAVVMSVETDRSPYAPPDKSLPMIVSQGSRKLSEMAKDLDAKVISAIAENEELKAREKSMKTALEENTKSFAAEAMRLNDQIAFLKKQCQDLQAQRDAFANYAIEIKTRCENLVKVLSSNATSVQNLIGQTIERVLKGPEEEMARMAAAIKVNADTAASLIEETLEAAKNDAVAQLQRRAT